ncbi:hypothetical protein LX70_04023 [Defluviimonas denitrificans]|jgi:hypothetical protein|uniref:Uncharacterized protein n=1 Tax=Albidovulum denitrificans TaxID=404881 RepID=A0A2S8RWQ1_9RHOB|nr:hypothetical protein [Defluviimonas denitrificans]PQV52917.1 hypothetical protein LX70_04023 [Defluviimonas denitrificans]
MKASARKSLGEFKPLIIHDSGRTEVVGKRGHTEHWQALTNGGETYHPVRGVTFPDRGEAVAYAQRHIDRLLEARARRDRERAERHARYATQSS